MDIIFTGNEQDPLYKALYVQIRRFILNGTIKAGMKLPSIRSLCEQLNVSKTTIETTYQMLLEEGIVVSKPRSGLFVAFSDQILPLIPHIEVVTTSKGEIENEHNFTHSIDNDTLIDFSLLTVDKHSFPARTWKSVWNEALNQHLCSIHQYGDSK
ncbi:GntR family transcriptional regulator [Paenibacillus sp. L3-i20]|uniref:GntR family transcriptional regulator n=1 Tax=Paenibacillus sp. L3-i20 TaxID=2905833 RepID=UPI001EDE2FEB|nr:GntR family transcriptional regulator [Paenibacillus sp. L3-i20]GKU78074.1 hypothetical protein L3i20_v224710 [Paenibacillus sp. L3-i20]